MTKDKALKIIKNLIDDEKEALENYHKAIMEFSDSSRLIDELKVIYDEESEHLSRLDRITKDIEGYDVEREAQLRRFDDITGCCYYGDHGLVFEAEKEEE